MVIPTFVQQAKGSKGLWRLALYMYLPPPALRKLWMAQIVKVNSSPFLFLNCRAAEMCFSNSSNGSAKPGWHFHIKRTENSTDGFPAGGHWSLINTDQLLSGFLWPVVQSRPSTFTSGLNWQQQILLVNQNVIGYYKFTLLLFFIFLWPVYLASAFWKCARLKGFVENSNYLQLDRWKVQQVDSANRQ